MSIFDSYLPWTEQRLALFDDATFKHYFQEASNVVQDQRIPITNLMVVLYPKVNTAIDLSKAKNRLKLVQWYQAIGHKTFRVEELELLLSGQQHEPKDQVQIKLPKLVPGGINLVGYARSMSGLGDDIRGLIAMMTRLELPFSVCCLGHPSDHEMYADVPNEVLQPNYSSTIFCMNGFEFSKLSQIYTKLSEHFGYVVLQAPWELPKLVPEWQTAFSSVNKFWAISEFVKAAFQNAGYNNVVYNRPLVDMPFIETKRHQSGQRKPFTFLYVFDAASFLSRKNPSAAVSCFQNAFQSSENVRLILKVSNADRNADFAQLESKCASDKRISIQKNPLSPEQVVELINKCDCYLSLHRSEGFGRTIAQASLLAKPIISTQWSGSIDILPEQCHLSVPFTLIPVKEGEYPSFKNQHWAEVDVANAIAKIQEIYAMSADSRLQLGEENQRFSEQRFTLEANLAHYNEQLKQVIQHGNDHDCA